LYKPIRYFSGKQTFCQPSDDESLAGELTNFEINYGEFHVAFSHHSQYHRNNNMTKTKIALVLGGGGARGLAHIGVLKVLEKNHLPIDIIVGTSIGALIGGFYAARTSIELIEKMALSVDLKFVAKMLAPSFSTSGLVDGERVRSFLGKFLGEIKIEDMTIPFSSVATDLTTGEEVIFTSGSLVDAIMASIAIPMLFNPVHYQNRYLVDGGLVNPLPVSVAYRLGAEVIIAANVTPLPSTLARHSKNHVPFRPD
jgi:NTE family protein